MAKSKFEYVKEFEEERKCLPNSWIVVRVDGKGFHRFTDLHGFEKPNDRAGLSLMTRAAVSVFEEFRDVIIAFGHSDEYSFVFRKDMTLFNRRSEKLVSLVSSLFSSSYVFNWSKYFEKEMLYPPLFDARLVLYPTDDNLRDYLSWRQADAHINNLYNTCFWKLVNEKGLSTTEAEKRLRGTFSNDKNELLFNEFGVNYNNEPEMYRKGTTLIRKFMKPRGEGKPCQVVIPFYCDIIKKHFWEEHSELLALKPVPTLDDDCEQFFTISSRVNVQKVSSIRDDE